MSKSRPIVISTSTLDSFVTKLQSVRDELEGLSPAPRVTIDRDALLALVTGALEAIRTLQVTH